MEEREEEKKLNGTRKTLGGFEERRGLHIQGSPSLGGAQLGQKGTSFSVGREDGNQHAGQSETCTQGTDPALPTQPDTVSSDADKTWVLERGVRRVDPGRRVRLDMRRHPVGTGGREKLCNWDACGGSLNHQRSRAALLSDAEGKNLLAACLPLCLSLPLQAPCMAPT